MKSIYSVFIILLFFKGYSQELASYFKMELNKKSQSFSYVDKQNDNAYVFVNNNKKTKSICFDSDFTVKDSMSIKSPDDLYENIVGANKNEECLNLYWSSESKNKICCQRINFVNKTFSIKTFDIDFSKQKLLQSFSSNDNFYMLSIIKNTSILKLIIFDNIGNKKEENIDLSKFNFYTSSQQICSLYDVFSENLKPFESSFELPVIDIKTPISLSLTAKKRKCYFDEKELIITLDTNQNFTQLIRINLSNFKFELISFNQKNIDNLNAESNESIKFNSLLVDNTIYQLKLNESQLFFSISDLEGKVLKQFDVNKDNPISFNSSKLFYQFVNGAENPKKAEKSDYFLNILSNSNVGIVYYKYKDKNLITIGSVSEHINKQNEDDQNAKMMLFASGGLIGSLVYVTFFNQINVNTDFSRDTAYFYSYLDSSYNLDTEKVNYYNFDLIKKFFKIDPELVFPTIATLKKGHLLGYYKPSTKYYTFKKYTKD